jgi:N-acetyl-gamma-glutamyl-phosphate reductase
MEGAMPNVAILGASGYAGAELVRLVAGHGDLRIGALAADRRAGEAMGDVFPHLGHLALPRLRRIDEIDFSDIDLAFCALPHATTQEVVSALPRSLKVVDLSADFRLRDPAVYAEWYGREHSALDLQEEAVYGLTEFYREEIRAARLCADTGCNAAAGLYPVLPLLEAGLIDPEEIVIDLKTGVSGAGRGAKEAMLFAEVSEGFHAYNICKHRHLAEFEQEFSKAAGRPVSCAFVAHLVPMNRGILATVYVKGDPRGLHAALADRYAGEPFIDVLPFGASPHTRHVRGANLCRIGVAEDRRPGRAVLVSVIDNLMKGASGQAVQNANLMLGLPETQGLAGAPLFP